MALDPKVSATGMTKALMKAAGLREQTPAEMGPQPPLEPDEDPISPSLVTSGDDPDQSTWAEDFAEAYNEYVLDGEVPSAENTGGETSILEGAFTGANINPPILGLAFAEYWATVAILPGIPELGGIAVVSSTNNAMALGADFTSAVKASITTKESKPYFLDLVKNVEAVAKTIEWTVIENTVVGPSVVPITHIVNIS